MWSFSQIIQNIRTTSINAKQAGTKFEILVLRWFLATPLYDVKRGWLWADFAKAIGKEANDLGIDLVLEMNDGEFWAVQCKFYNKSSRIDEDKVSHFLGHQGVKFTLDRKSRTFSRFVWVDTDAVWGKNAEKYVHGRDNFTRLSMSVLANSNVDWDAIVKGRETHIEPKKPRDYQKEVIHKAEAHFKNNERGKVIMACGTGKTDLSLVWFTAQTQENRSDYQRTKGKNTGNLPSMDLWLQEDCSRTWTYERPSLAGSRYNS